MTSRGTRTRSRSDDHLDAVFRALGDRTRRAIVARLARGPTPVTELAAPFAISLPAISRHLKVLESAGLVVRAVEGRVHRCSLGVDALEEAEDWIARYRSFWEDTLESLANYAEPRRDAGR